MKTLQSPEILSQTEAPVWDPEYQRKFDNLTTWTAEMLEGNMRTPFEFTYDGEELYGRDGKPLGPVFEDAIEDAKRKAQENPDLAFLLRMAYLDRGEYYDMLAMASGETEHNTMIVESNFPGELENATEDVEGINVKRRPTMQRVIALRPDGVITMVSQTLEGSDRDALEAIYDYLEEPAQPGELLGQRRYKTLQPDEQEFFSDALMGVYDRKLEEKYGGSYRAGWRLPTERAFANTYEFVLAQPDLVHSFLKDGSLNEQSLYGFAAAMRQRFEDSLKPRLAPKNYTKLVEKRDPVAEMYLAAAVARAKGLVFSGCGISIGGGEGQSTQDQMGEMGYGTGVATTQTCEFISKECPLCHAENVPTKSTETSTEVRVEGECGCKLVKAKTTELSEFAYAA